MTLPVSFWAKVFFNLTPDQKGVALPFFSNGRHFSVARYDDGLVGQGQDSIVQGAHDLLHRTSGEIGAADGSGKKRIARNQLLFGFEVKTDAALGVAGSMQDFGGM